MLDWTGGLTVSGGRVTSPKGYAIDSPGGGFVSWARDAVRGTSHAIGDWDRVVLGLEAHEDTVLAIEAGGMALAVRLGDLGDDGVERHGSLLEQQIVAQRLAAKVAWRDPAPCQRVTQMDGELAWSSPSYVTWARSCSDSFGA